MDVFPHPGHLEPRKKVRIRMRADLSIVPQQYEGRTYYVIKDPVGLHYYRYTEQEHFLLSRMDGTATLDDARQAFEQRFRPQRLTLPEVESFAQQLLTTGLAHAESAQGDKQLYQRRRQQRRNEWLQILSNVLYIKVPLYDPDRLLTRLLPPLRGIFTGGFMFLSVGVLLAAVLLVATHFEAFLDKLPAARELFSVRTLLSAWLGYAVVKVIHEFGHGLSCKAFGGEVHETGALFLCFTPCLYVNTSDAWTLPNKWKRIIVSFAGIYIELLIAALATFVWWNTPAESGVNNLALGLMVVCSLNTLLFNGNPLLRYDGYYMLADWLEIPNLRGRANDYLKHLAAKHCLGVRVPATAYMETWRRLLFVSYAVLSYLYTWIVTYGILWFLHRLFKPYGLEAISTLLALTALGSMVGWPLYRLGKSLGQRGRLPHMSPWRVLASLGAVAAAGAFIALVPLPVSQVCQVALVQLEPDASEKVFVLTPGILERLHVRDGQRVEQGDRLAEFRSLEVENELEQARSEHDVRMVEIRALRDQAVRLIDPFDRARVEAQVATASAERDRFAGQVEVYEKVSKLLVLRAPRAGVVLGAPHVDAVGKFWDRGEETPFCTVGDPTRPQALMPVTPAEFRLLREDLGAQPDLPVTIRIQGRGGQTWAGKLSRLPESEAKEVPIQLTVKGGGGLAAKPGTKPQRYVPASQQYLLGVDFLQPDASICPGTMAQVKIHCRWRTCAWWFWRTVTSTFDLELL